MAGQWRVRVSGTRRDAVDIDLLVQAVVALGRQITREQYIAVDELERPDPVGTPQQGVES